MKQTTLRVFPLVVVLGLIGCATAGNTDDFTDTFTTDTVDTSGYDTGVDTAGDSGCAAGLTDCGGECFNLLTDIYHCGSCDNACTTPGVNMEASCVSGSCDYYCQSGFWDVDDIAGCEYPCTFTSGTETCNGTDDNCDGNADEGFPCAFGAETACTTVCMTLGSGTCGTHCEIPSPEDCTPPAELCNGIDDDCDGDTDEDWPPGTCGECVPDCTGRDCGMEPVCYTSCGTCDIATEICNSSGICECVPSCTGRECGPDPICSTPCGTCTFPEVCDASGRCVSSCTPDCTGRVCGLDPVCGESCGTCTLPETCTGSGLCVCTADCSGRECGLDPVCATSCGSCVSPETCDATGTCVGGCTPTTEVCNGLDDDCDSVADNGAGMECVRSTTGIFCITGGGVSGSQDCSASCILSDCCAATETCDNGFDDDCDGDDDTTDTDCPVGPGTSCADAIDVSSLATWSGAFADFPNDWSGGSGCGYASGTEVWFTATVPAGYLFSAEETSYTDVVLERVVSCTATSCLDYTDTPETMEYHNDTSSPVDVIIIVERYSGSSGSVSMEFSNVPPPDGYTCADAIDATSLSNWSGTYADYDNTWSGGSGCGYGNGREVWFTIDVAAGDIFTIEETSYTDVVIQQVSSCSATTCLDYTDSPETMEFYNDTGSPQTLTFIVEAYSSSSTGSVDVDFTNSSPPEGYSCADAVDATSLSNWSGTLADYANDWSAGSSCGYSSGREIWFTADVAAGDLFSIEETSYTDVVVQQVSSCSATTCLDYTDSPELIEYHNDSGSPQTLTFIVEAYSSSSTGSVDVDFTNSSPPEGYSCADAIDVSLGGTWSGTYADYANDWSYGSGCGYTSGRDIWFTARVPDGQILSLEETTSTDTTIQQVTACGATTCDDYWSSPEQLEWYNDTGSAQTLWFNVEAYYSSTTGSYSIDASVDPPLEGYACSNPIDASMLSSWSGSFADYADLWDTPSGCGSSYGSEIWFEADVADGNTLTFDETSFTDVVIIAFASCTASSCIDYNDSGDILSITNTTGSTQTVVMVVECYSCTTSSINLTITNAP